MYHKPHLAQALSRIALLLVLLAVCGQSAQTPTSIPSNNQLSPALVDRLSELKDKDMVKVAIWAAGKPGRTQEERNALLAEKFPEVKEALARSGNPFEVSDLELQLEITKENSRLMDEDTEAQLTPISEYLQSLGYESKLFEAMPALTVTLPKSLILELQSREDVGGLTCSQKNRPFSRRIFQS